MSSPIQETFSLASMPWPTLDPFLFCVHHLDKYPAGNEAMGPVTSLAGRQIGSDFSGKDGWSMYHGSKVPGFPGHPHRGFETITLARNGFIDHSDSLGATARFGHGDVQWMTAGKGVVHCEMFPLVNQDRENPTELFQIWLNLPAKKKLVEPHFTMFWSEKIPRQEHQDAYGKTTIATVIAGALADLSPLSPPPDSWASEPDAHLAVWTLEMDASAEYVLPAAPEGAMRVLYFFEGDTLQLGGTPLKRGLGAVVDPEKEMLIQNGDKRAEMLILQGRPIGEPVAQHGPFVMNTTAEIRQAMSDYQNTGFGGWPWPNESPVHPRDRGRFAIHADGRKDQP